MKSFTVCFWPRTVWLALSEIVVKTPNCIEDKRMITRVRMISEVVRGRVKLLSWEEEEMLWRWRDVGRLILVLHER